MRFSGLSQYSFAHSLRSASTGFIRAARQAGRKPAITPVNTETASATRTKGIDMLAGNTVVSTWQMGKAMDNPIKPPSRQIVEASIKNWIRIVRRLAPMALRMPISRVRSATETNMMFMMPIPPTKRDSPVMNSPAVAITPLIRLNVLMNASCELTAKSSGAPDDFAVNSQEAFIKTFNRMSGVIATAGLFITGLSLFVGGIGIMYIMFVSLAERTRELGIRKAIGAKRRTILIQFLIEASTICLGGGLIGLAVAFPITQVLTTVLPASMSLTLVIIALTVSVLTGVIAGFLPAWRAARMNPVDALRNE